MLDRYYRERNYAVIDISRSMFFCTFFIFSPALKTTIGRASKIFCLFYTQKIYLTELKIVHHLKEVALESESSVGFSLYLNYLQDVERTQAEDDSA